MSMIENLQKKWMLNQINSEEKSDFNIDFTKITDKLSEAFKLDDAIFENTAALKRGVGGTLNRFNSYSDQLGFGEYLNVNFDKMQNVLIEELNTSRSKGTNKLWVGGISLKVVDDVTQGWGKGGAVTREQALGKIILGAAKVKALTSVNGIPETYATARSEATNAIRIIEKAAAILFDTEAGAIVDMTTLLDKATHPNKGLAWKLGAGSLAVATIACAGSIPTESKPNFNPTLPVENPPVLSSPIPSTNLETPKASMPEFESPVAATLVKMDSVKTEQLRDKFNEGDVVYYEIGLDPTSGKPTSRLNNLNSEARKSMKLINSIVMSEPSGGKWECLIFGNNDGNEGVFSLICNTENGMFIPRQIYDPTTGLMSWSFYIDAKGNYPVDFSEAYVVRPVVQFLLDEKNLVNRGWMWSKIDGKLHEIKDVETQFKSAIPALSADQYGAETDLEKKYGEGDYSWPDDGRPTLTFDNGMVFEWNGEEYIEVMEDLSVSETAVTTEIEDNKFSGVGIELDGKNYENNPELSLFGGEDLSAMRALLAQLYEEGKIKQFVSKESGYTHPMQLGRSSDGLSDLVMQPENSILIANDGRQVVYYIQPDDFATYKWDNPNDLPRVVAFPAEEGGVVFASMMMDKNGKVDVANWMWAAKGMFASWEEGWIANVVNHTGVSKNLLLAPLDAATVEGCMDRVKDESARSFCEEVVETRPMRRALFQKMLSTGLIPEELSSGQVVSIFSGFPASR